MLVVAGLAIPRSAFAHLVLVSSAPPAGSTLAAAPAAVGLSFSEDPQLGATHIEVVNASGVRVDSGTPRLVHVPKHTLEVPLVGSLAAGRYTVRWRTTSDDGHPAHGAFSFTIAMGAVAVSTAPPPAPSETGVHAGQPMVMDTTEAGGFDVESPLYVIVRWVSFVAMLALVGAIVLARWVTPRAAAGRPELARRVDANALVVFRLATALLLIDAALRLAAQVAALRGNPPMPVDVPAILTTTVWGWAWLFELAAAIVAIVAALKAGAARWRVAEVAAFVLALSFAFSGHAAAATHLRALAVSADALHILAAGCGFGTLFGVAVVAMPACLAQDEGARGAAAADFANAFSPVALTSAGVLVATGIVAAWLHLGSWHAFVDSDYGRTLLIKLALVATVVALGAINWRILRPALGTEAAARRLRRSAALELIAAAAVLAATAVLVASSPPADMTDMGAAQPAVAPAATAASAPADGIAIRARVPRTAGT
ncbi:MAG TPA: copper resistance protein CopC [Gemmatimonadaceae bacterium]|nr:copper resistance protein CopC [Gemmatimonadaceae bacterium]